MKLTVIGILSYFCLTAIYNIFGLDVKIWDMLYFAKENVICLLFSILLIKKSNNTFEILILYSLSIYFGLRFIFDIVAFGYSNSMIFSIIFIAINLISLVAVKYLYKWTK